MSQSVELFGKEDHRSNLERWFFVFIMLVAFWLRVRGLFVNGLHGDEALFGTWARWIANGQDFWLTGQVVDKPPLLFYVQGLFWQLLDGGGGISADLTGSGQTDFALRLPNLIASLFLLPFIYKIALTLFNDNATAQLALLFFALSPFLIQFSPTAFTDPLMLTLTAASTLVILRSPRRRIPVTVTEREFEVTGILRVAQNDMALGAGLLFGLAVGVKLNALLLLPLVMVALWWRGLDWRRFVLGFGVVVGVVVLWFAGSQGPGQWLGSGDALLVRGIRPISSYELIPRWQQWQEILLPTLGFDIRIVMMTVAGIVLWRGGMVERVLAAFGIGYFAFHWLLATAQYDRYMLPFVALLLLLLARSVVLAVQALRLPSAAPLLLIFVLLWPNAAAGRLGRWDVGGMRGADFGTAELTAFFADEPYGTVLYDHFYSWHARYYLFDSRVYVAWMPHPDNLVADLDAHYDEGRYLILPSDARAGPFEDALKEAGYGLEMRLQSGEITVFKIMEDG